MLQETEQRPFGVLMALGRRPDAWAAVSGSPESPEIHGVVRFFQNGKGVLVAVEVRGLPKKDGQCVKPFFGFHIHSGGACTGNETDPFADAGAHYDPDHCPHPSHRGDLPPLYACGGKAMQVFLTDRFCVREIIGKTVIIHSEPDDVTSQPGGNAGARIACGEIRPVFCCK